MEPYRTIWSHKGLYGTILDHIGSFGTIPKHMGPIWTNWDHTGPYRSKHEHTGAYGTIKDHTRLYGTIRDQSSGTKNPTEWECRDEDRRIKLCFLNCRSIVDKFHNIKSDRSLLKSNVLILTETWLEFKNKEEEYQLPNFTANFCCKGRGKGLASYSYDGGFQHVMNLNQDGFSITKLENETLDIIGI